MRLQIYSLDEFYKVLHCKCPYVRLFKQNFSFNIVNDLCFNFDTYVNYITHLLNESKCKLNPRFCHNRFKESHNIVDHDTREKKLTERKTNI